MGKIFNLTEMGDELFYAYWQLLGHWRNIHEEPQRQSAKDYEALKAEKQAYEDEIRRRLCQ